MNLYKLHNNPTSLKHHTTMHDKFPVMQLEAESISAKELHKKINITPQQAYDMIMQLDPDEFADKPSFMKHPDYKILMNIAIKDKQLKEDLYEYGYSVDNKHLDSLFKKPKDDFRT